MRFLKFDCAKETNLATKVKGNFCANVGENIQRIGNKQ